MTGPITVATMNAAITEYNKQHDVNLHPPPGIVNDSKKMREFVEHYIVFVDDRGRVAKMARGSGMGGVSDEDVSMSSSENEELPTPAPVAPYNDVRNDPYFVMR